MGRFEVTFRKFAILSGVRQEAGDYAICVQPPTSALQRRGTLMLMSEPAGLHASFGVDACRVAQNAVIEHYYGDHSLSLTSGLINALDSANNTLLQYNYEKSGERGNQEQPAAVAVQGGGVATRKARVGLTAVLVRPDGGGIYIAQTAPAQLYIVHNGLLTAIPNPPGWEVEQPGPVSMAGQQDANVEEADEEFAIPSFQAAPLGSRPGVEADLLFRRVEAGDLLVAVSSGLAKRIERVTAERLFVEGDPDTIMEALHEMSVQFGIAEAHACALQLGTEVRSGVETDFRPPLQAPHGGQMDRNGGANIMPPDAAEKRGDLKSALSSPRKWLARRNNDDATDQPDPSRHDVEGSTYVEGDSPAVEAMTFSAHPTGTLLNRTVERPPFQVAQPDITMEPPESEELEFDGWEDMPPALSLVGDAARQDSIQADEVASSRIIFKPSGRADRPMTSGSGALQHSPYKVPTLFELAGEEEEPADGMTRIGPPSRANGAKISIGGMGRQTAGVLKTALVGLIPDRTPSSSGKVATGKGRPVIVPARLLIACGVLILSGLLLFSVFSMAAGGDKKTTSNLLEQAKQEDLLANQPNLSEVERKQRLSAALSKAKEARSASPQSNEAQLLVTTIQTKIDKSEGVTRLSQIKPLFNLASTGANAAATPGTTAKAPVVQPSGSLPITGTASLKEIVVQGNDAFILDSASQKIYRCKIAAQNCAVVLSAGDSVAGQKVGKLSTLTSRITNVVALDDARVTYVFDPDSNAWQSQPLGDAAKLQQPKDIATYDGNLYLLDAKPGQVSKYASGAYGEVPADWLTDPTGVAQMKDPVSIAIDGVIYVALKDGKILTMQGGKVARTISPRDTGSGALPTDLFTGTDTKDLYLLRASEGSISKISKEGQTLAILKAPLANEELATIDGMTVDEARGKLYLIAGTKVYEGQLPVPGTASAPAEDGNGKEQKPTVRPTAEP